MSSAEIPTERQLNVPSEHMPELKAMADALLGMNGNDPRAVATIFDIIARQSIEDKAATGQQPPQPAPSTEPQPQYQPGAAHTNGYPDGSPRAGNGHVQFQSGGMRFEIPVDDHANGNGHGVSGNGHGHSGDGQPTHQQAQQPVTTEYQPTPETGPRLNTYEYKPGDVAVFRFDRTSDVELRDTNNRVVPGVMMAIGVRTAYADGGAELHGIPNYIEPVPQVYVCDMAMMPTHLSRAVLIQDELEMLTERGIDTSRPEVQQAMTNAVRAVLDTPYMALLTNNPDQPTQSLLRAVLKSDGSNVDDTFLTVRPIPESDEQAFITTADDERSYDQSRGLSYNWLAVHDELFFLRVPDIDPRKPHYGAPKTEYKFPQVLVTTSLIPLDDDAPEIETVWEILNQSVEAERNGIGRVTTGEHVGMAQPGNGSERQSRQAPGRGLGALGVRRLTNEDTPAGGLGGVNSTTDDAGWAAALEYENDPSVANNGRRLGRRRSQG